MTMISHPIAGETDIFGKSYPDGAKIQISVHTSLYGGHYYSVNINNSNREVNDLILFLLRDWSKEIGKEWTPYNIVVFPHGSKALVSGMLPEKDKTVMLSSMNSLICGYSIEENIKDLMVSERRYTHFEETMSKTDQIIMSTMSGLKNGSGLFTSESFQDCLRDLRLTSFYVKDLIGKITLQKNKDRHNLLENKITCLTETIQGYHDLIFPLTLQISLQRQKNLLEQLNVSLISFPQPIINMIVDYGIMPDHVRVGTAESLKITKEDDDKNGIGTVCIAPR